MSQRPFEAVMHCTRKQVNKLINLAYKVIDFLTKNAATYPDPAPKPGDMKTEADKLVTLQGNVHNGGTEATAARDKQVTVVFDMLKDELLYVNKIGNGNKDVLLLSGFDVNEQPSPHHVPDQVAIKRTEPGPVEHSQKIFLADNSSPLEITKQHVSFHVEVTTGDPNDPHSWDDAELMDGKIGVTGNSKGIVVVHLEEGKKTFVRIAGMNSDGTGAWSDPTSFYAQ